MELVGLHWGGKPDEQMPEIKCPEKCENKGFVM
jgi:hypothetical protein